MAAAAEPQDAASPERAMEQLKTYDYGQSEQPLHAIELYVVRYATDAARRAEVAARLAAILAAPKTSYAAKVFICQRLLVVGSEAQVPLLAKMLDDPQTAEIARYTLEAIPGEASLAALRGALKRFKGMPLLGAINSLGVRRDEKSAGELAGLLGNADLLVAAAAAEVLGKIGSTQAAAALATAEVPAKARAALHNAQLQCAERLAAAGNTAGATAIYQQIWSSNRPSPWRLAGLTGLAKVDPDKAAPAGPGSDGLARPALAGHGRAPVPSYRGRRSPPRWSSSSTSSIRRARSCSWACWPSAATARRPRP